MSLRRSADRTTAPRAVGRRSLLKAAGASAAAASFGATLLPSRASAADEEALYDVVIIGAGYAGGTVARELSARGMNPVVLEARNRVGGRIWTDTFLGQQIDVGGGWVSPDQHLVMAEYQRYGMSYVAESGADVHVMPGESGFQSLAPEEAVGRLDPLVEQFMEGSQQYFERPHDPLYRSDLIAEVDQLSFADRIAQLDLSPLDRTWLSGYTSVYVGADNNRGAMTTLAQWWALGGFTSAGWHAQMSQKPTSGGMVSLLNAMLDDSSATVVYNSPATRVVESGGLVRVTAGRRIYSAPAVVVATPVNLWSSIDFRPGLPPVHAAAATNKLGIAHATKLWIQISTPSSTYGQGTVNSPIQMLLPERVLPDGTRLMIAFGGPSLDLTSKDAVQSAVRDYIPGATVLEYRAQDWGADPWARGGWGMRRPGDLLQQLPAIQQPHGRIVFAGGDIASGWNGAFVEGAIESGFTAAQQVAALVP
ncbi:flavin monoamine oxidase family protein [Streptomyces marincola]|uniref:Amine oxidase n=1 Tax=Streptomyces marincola TaxID=2878388 RepID=A0A1W7D227_9ACTN|nr:NAD(P)/FAD-dependent oxidoreductase [Streptomyces marincola]ARQ71076.1 amine oxidase [Streptomyces marincola]